VVEVKVRVDVGAAEMVSVSEPFAVPGVVDESVTMKVNG
jgi:hypothetical protein